VRAPSGIGLGSLQSRARCRDGLTRQLDCETSATPRNISHPNRSAMLRNDSITDAQAQAGSFSHGFCRVEGIENSRWIFDREAAVREFDDQVLTFHPRSNPKIAFLGTLQDSVHRVVYHVEKHLLQFMRICSRHRKIGSEVQMDPNVAHP